MGQLSLPFPEDNLQSQQETPLQSTHIPKSRSIVQKSVRRVVSAPTPNTTEMPIPQTEEQAAWKELLYLLYEEPLSIDTIFELLEAKNITTREAERRLYVQTTSEKDLGSTIQTQSFEDHMRVRLPVYRAVVRLLAEGKATTASQAKQMWVTSRRLG